MAWSYLSIQRSFWFYIFSSVDTFVIPLAAQKLFWPCGFCLRKQHFGLKSKVYFSIKTLKVKLIKFRPSEALRWLRTRHLTTLWESAPNHIHFHEAITWEVNPEKVIQYTERPTLVLYLNQIWHSDVLCIFTNNATLHAEQWRRNVGSVGSNFPHSYISRLPRFDACAC